MVVVSFKEKIKSHQQKQISFFGSDGFQRIEDVAGVMTLARGKSMEERGFIGRFVQSFIAVPMASPILMGGFLASSGEKIILIGEALTIRETKPQIRKARTIIRKIENNNDNK